MIKVQYTPEKLAEILQKDFLYNHYKLKIVNYYSNEHDNQTITVTENNLVAIIINLIIVFQAGVRETESTNGGFADTFINVDYFEEYDYGLKVFLKEGSPYNIVTLAIEDFKPQEDK